MTRSIHRDSGDKRPIARDLHPLEVGNYRIGTPAIETFYDLVKNCMDHKITGAPIYGPSRIGKTRAIEYLRLAMAQNFAKVTTYHVQAEHKPKHAEGPFFTSLLEAVGCCRIPFKLSLSTFHVVSGPATSRQVFQGF